MSPHAAFNSVLDSVDALSIHGSDDEVTTTLLAIANSIFGIALLRLPPSEREAIIFGLEGGVRDFINQVNARRSMIPKASNGHAN
jgi:hypothetical protein